VLREVEKAEQFRQVARKAPAGSSLCLRMTGKKEIKGKKKEKAMELRG
jgi:hypothetical protein